MPDYFWGRKLLFLQYGKGKSSFPNKSILSLTRTYSKLIPSTSLNYKEKKKPLRRLIGLYLRVWRLSRPTTGPLGYRRGVPRRRGRVRAPWTGATPTKWTRTGPGLVDPSSESGETDFPKHGYLHPVDHLFVPFYEPVYPIKHLFVLYPVSYVDGSCRDSAFPRPTSRRPKFDKRPTPKTAQYIVEARNQRY